MDHRKEVLGGFVDRLFERWDDTVSAIVADGWSREMAEAGLHMHRKTWDVDVAAACIRRELTAVGGMDALSGPTVRVPDSAVHVWPSLPGAGLTPFFYGFLLGVSRQFVRPSRRAQHFARHVGELWREIAGDDSDALRILAADEAWDFADLTIVSGADETVSEIRRRVEPSGDVIGYGHRVSFSLVVDDGRAEACCDGLATDIVMWHQRGCFSSRAVIFVGSSERARTFGAALADAIERAEERLHAHELLDEELAARAQRRGVAEFGGHEIRGDGVGWVELTDEPFRGERIAPHAVTLHVIERPADVRDVIEVPRRHLQGVALHADADRDEWMRALSRIGVTRICAPGELQSPPADWPHDGRPNALSWLTLTGDG